MVFLVNLHQAIIIGGADNIRLEVAFVADQGHQESEINFIGIRHPINIFLKAFIHRDIQRGEVTGLNNGSITLNFDSLAGIGPVQNRRGGRLRGRKPDWYFGKQEPNQYPYQQGNGKHTPKPQILFSPLGGRPRIF